MRVHVVGNVCIDTTFRSTACPAGRNSMPTAMPTAWRQGASRRRCCTGASIDFLAVTGKDLAAATIRERLSQEFDTSPMPAIDMPTDRSTIMVDDNGENITSAVSPVPKPSSR